MLKLLSAQPITAPCEASYQGFAYDGCFFYLTKQQAHEVVRLNDCPGEEWCFATCRQYSRLCFDQSEGCFWAASDHCPGMLFRLDRSFREVDSFHIRGSEVGEITGISYDCCEDKLLVSAAPGIAWVNKDTGATSCWRSRLGQRIVDVVSLSPYFICCTSGSKALVRLYHPNGEQIGACALPDRMQARAAVFALCGQGGCHLYVLAIKNFRYPYLLNFAVCCDALCPPISRCNCLPCAPAPCHCDRTCACEDLLESVAQMETALSHILNAEGEKLQKIIACSDDPCVILAANQSVNSTLIHATHLEQVMYDKLEVARDVCGQCMT